MQYTLHGQETREGPLSEFAEAKWQDDGQVILQVCEKIEDAIDAELRMSPAEARELAVQLVENATYAENRK